VAPVAPRSETAQAVSENSQLVLLSIIPQVASRGPAGVIRQADSPNAKARPSALQVQSECAGVTHAAAAAVAAAKTRAWPPHRIMRPV